MTPETPTPDAAAAEPAVSPHVLDSAQAGRRFLRGGSLRLLAFAGGLIVGVGVTPLVVHHLGARRWGDYGKVASLLFIVAALTEGGLGQMGLRELSIVDDAEQRGEFMRELIGLRLTLTLMGVAGAVVFGVLAGWGTVVVTGIVLAGAGSVLTNLQGTLALPLGASMRLGWLALGDFLPQLASALVMLVLVLAGAALLPFYVAPLAAGAAALALTAWVIRGELSLRPRFTPHRWRALLSQTFVYAMATATGAAYFRIAMVATSLLSTSLQTGYFALAFRILELGAVIPWLLVGSAFPILLRSAFNDTERLRYALQRLCEGGLLLGAWLGMCLVFGAPFAIHVLEGGGNAFAPSVGVLRILGGAIAATFPLAIFSYTLLSLRMYRELVLLNVVVIVLALILSPILIDPLGARGAAVLSLVLEVSLCVGYAVVLFRTRAELRPRLAGLERILLAIGLALVAGWLLRVHPVLSVLAASVTLAVAALALRVVPAELLELVRRAPPVD